MKLGKYLLALLFPEKCVLCGKVLEKEEMDLCHSCRIHAPECPISRKKYPFIDSWTALWYYEGEVRRSLLRYKFYGRRNYADVYGRLLAMKLLKEERTDVDVLTYIPISPKRRRKRGFDQVELVTKKVAQELNIPCVAVMKKVRHNRPQSGIVGDAQRRANVLGAYAITDGEAIRGKRVLLLDDIVTTGATAGEAARVLLTAGAKEVHLAVVAMAKHENKSGR